MKYYLVLVLIFFAPGACKKASGHPDCFALERAILNEDYEAVVNQINHISHLIGKLPDKISFSQTESSLQELVQKVNTRCRVRAELLCTLCIETLPGQSVIRLTTSDPEKSVFVDLFTESGTYIRGSGVHM